MDGRGSSEARLTRRWAQVRASVGRAGSGFVGNQHSAERVVRAAGATDERSEEDEGGLSVCSLATHARQDEQGTSESNTHSLRVSGR